MLKPIKLVLLLASISVIGAWSAHADTDVPLFSCTYNYFSEGREVNALLTARMLYEPYGKRVLELLEAKSKAPIFEFTILKIENSERAISIFARGSLEGVPVPVKLIIATIKDGKSIISYGESANESSEVQCQVK